MFEYYNALSFSGIFQVPLEVNYGGDPSVLREGVLWRGRAEFDSSKKQFVAKEWAPGAGSDLYVTARGYYILGEATLRYSPRQWKEEIEPIFRHLEDFIDKNRLDSDSVFLAFLTPSEVLKQTFDWIHARAEDYKVVTLTVPIVAKLLQVSAFVAGLPHAAIRTFLSIISERLREAVTANDYIRHLEDDLSSWCNDVLDPYLDTYLSMKTYSILLSTKGPQKITTVTELLSRDPDVVSYLKLGGIVASDADAKQTSKVIRDKRKQLVRQLQLLGLGREINDHLEELPWEEFENRILKMYGEAESIRQAGAETKSVAVSTKAS
jgi:hypothetical protein